MLEKFRAPPMQAVLLVFKVVHDPADAALKQRKDITKKVEDAVLDEVIDAIGAKIGKVGKVGKTVGAMSGSAGLVNPNLIMEYKHAQVPQARALGATMPLGVWAAEENALKSQRFQGYLTPSLHRKNGA